VFNGFFRLGSYNLTDTAFRASLSFGPQTTVSYRRAYFPETVPGRGINENFGGLFGFRAFDNLFFTIALAHGKKNHHNGISPLTSVMGLKSKMRTFMKR
jgi:hypothetical protein